MDRTVDINKVSVRKETKGEQVVVFLHIPKAGGTTLHDILMDQYPEIRHLSSNGFKTLDEIRGFSDEEKEGIGVIRGHMNFGVHELLSKPCVYFTMLRDPVERILSHYYYVARDPRHPLYDEYVSKKMGLKDFIVSITENDNGQTRAFAGVADYLALFRRAEVPFGNCGRDVLETAKENLESFAVVGMTERFDETLILLKRILGWRQPPLYIKRNVTENRPLKEDISADVLDLIKKHNELDIELYRYATELLENQIKEQDASFQIELEYFKQLNDLYQKNYQLEGEHQALVQEHQALVQAHQALQQQFQQQLQALRQEHQALAQEHQALVQSRAVQFAREIGRHPMLLKAGKFGYGVLAKTFKSFKGK